MPTSAAATAADVAHWRRVIRVLPENADAPLRLAYRLASRPDARGEAKALADAAARLAGPGEIADAAESLIRDLRE